MSLGKETKMTIQQPSRKLQQPLATNKELRPHSKHPKGTEFCNEPYELGSIPFPAEPLD